ncbi:MAG: hypothetical protein M3404_08905, partial [Actinomycetota bacterium]|nr:hypothetical protein [Actinomycetota bacterium]
RSWSLLSLVIAGVAVVAVLVLVSSGSRLPSYVDDVTVVNPHQWDVGVDVTGAERQGWLVLGTVDRGASHAFEHVIDQGEQWVFRFSYGGVDGGELVVPRADLESSGWKVSVPEQFAERMQAAGMSPSE